MKAEQNITTEITIASLELKHLIADFNSGTHILDVAFEIAKVYGRIQGLLLALHKINTTKHELLAHAVADTMERATKTINNLF